jgi:MSHA pilin protein MshC
VKSITIDFLANIRMRAANQQSGFTLTELIMVIVILGILSVAAMPMWFSKADFEARGYFDEVLQAARYAQKMAVVSNCNVEFALTGTGATLRILASPHDHCAETAVLLPGKGTVITKPTGVSSNTAIVIFQPFGDVNSGTVINIGDHSMEIHAATGFVERL